MMNIRLHDAPSCVGHKVCFFAVIFESGFPKRSRGTDYVSTIRVIDQMQNQRSMAVNIFAESAEKLPYVGAVGDIIQLRNVLVQSYEREINFVFNKKFSSFALYKGMDGDGFVPYEYSSRFRPKDEDEVPIGKLRKWLTNFKLHEDSSKFPMFREIKEGNDINLACKILHRCEAAKDEWFIFVWDGTDTPPNPISSKLEDEIVSPLPLHLEPLPLPRELLCTLPAIGSILRITLDQGVEKNYLHLLDIGKWVKFVNIRLEVHAGLWRGVFGPCTKLRYTPNNDCLVVERQRLSDEWISIGTPCCFPNPSRIIEVKDVRAMPVTLRQVLTHSEVPAKFKCIVRVVAAMPCHAEEICSPNGIYRMQLTLEDSTARIRAFVVEEDGETFFDGYPGVDELTKKLNRILGIADGVKNAPRNPAWVFVCLESFYVSKADVWGTRNFRIFDSKIV